MIPGVVFNCHLDLPEIPPGTPVNCAVMVPTSTGGFALVYTMQPKYKGGPTSAVTVNMLVAVEAVMFDKFPPDAFTAQ